MAVNLLKKKYLALAASLLLAGHVQATELLNSSYVKNWIPPTSMSKRCRPVSMPRKQC